MRLSFENKEEVIEFDVEYRKRKTLKISIVPPNEIKVVAPIGTKEEDIINIVKTKANWIEKKLLYFKSINYEKVNNESYSDVKSIAEGDTSITYDVNENTNRNGTYYLNEVDKKTLKGYRKLKF